MPRAPSGSAGGLGVGTRATVRDARGPRRTALPGLGRGPPPKPPGGRVWVGRAVLGPLSGPPPHGPRCAPGCPGRDRPSRCGRAVSGVPSGSEGTVLTSAPSVLSFHVRSSPRPPCPHPSWACGCCGDHAAAGQHQPPQRQLIGERKRPIVWRAWAAEGAGEGGRLRPAAAAWDVCRLRQRRRAGGAGQRGGSAASRPGLPTMRPLSAQSGSFRLSGARAS